jgi:hypothetical protein
MLVFSTIISRIPISFSLQLRYAPTLPPLAGHFDVHRQLNSVKTPRVPGEYRAPYRVSGGVQVTAAVRDAEAPLRPAGTMPRAAIIGLASVAASCGRVSRCQPNTLPGAGGPGLASPADGMDPNDPWMASMHGVRPEYSGHPARALGSEVRTVPDAHRRADVIIGKLLRNARACSVRTKAACWGRSTCPTCYGRAEVIGLGHLSFHPASPSSLARLDAIDKPPGLYMNRRPSKCNWPSRLVNCCSSFSSRTYFRRQLAGLPWHLSE